MADGIGRVGFNQKRVQDAIDNIKEMYERMGTNIQKEWVQVIRTLQDNWVGEDEISYEKTLAKKINDLYEDARLCANAGMVTLYNLAKNWHENQKKNILNNAETVATGAFYVTLENISSKGNIVESKPYAIAIDQDRGLVKESSASSIKEELTSFKNTISKEVSQIVSASEISKAFFGVQSESIAKFITNLNSTMAAVVTAFGDMYTAIDTLAGTAYASMANIASEDATQSLSDMDNLAASAKTRWE